MEQGKTGTFDISGSKGMIGRISWSERYDIAANIHVVTITAFEIKATKIFGAQYYLGSNDNYGAVRVDSTDVAVFRNRAGSHYVTPGRYAFAPVQAAKGYAASPWESGEIRGREDGSCTVTIGVNTWGFGSGAGNGWHLNGEQQIQLTQLPRASAIGASDGDIGSASVLAITCRLPDAVHTVKYQFGSLSGYVTADGYQTDSPAQSRDFRLFHIPESFYGEIPDAPSGVCTLICTTWQGGTQIGEPQSTRFRVTAPEHLCRPAVTGTVEDVDTATVSLTGNDQVVVRYKSDMRCILAAEPKNGASLVSTSVNGQAVTGETVLENFEGGDIVFTARDSRGYTATYTIPPDVVPYVILTCNAQVKRTDPTSGNVALTVSGNCFGGSFGVWANELYIDVQTDGGAWQRIPATRVGDSYTVHYTLTGLDYLRRHTVVVRATDLLANVSKSVTVDKGIPLFDWGEHDFTFHIPVDLQAGLVGLKEDPAHPGCYFRIRDGEKEWLQPPMETGRVYRTSERFQGQPVYTRLDWGLLVPGGAQRLEAPGCDRIVRYGGCVGEGRPLPLLSGENADWVTVDAAENGDVLVRAGENLPEWGFYLQTWFTVKSSFQPDNSSAMLGLDKLGQIRLGEL